MDKVKAFWKKLRQWPVRHKRYKMIQENGINVWVETEASKAKTEKLRFFVNVWLSVISTLAAIVAAVFSALSYINN